MGKGKIVVLGILLAIFIIISLNFQSNTASSENMSGDYGKNYENNSTSASNINSTNSSIGNFNSYALVEPPEEVIGG